MSENPRKSEPLNYNMKPVIPGVPFPFMPVPPMGQFMPMWPVSNSMMHHYMGGGFIPATMPTFGATSFGVPNTWSNHRTKAMSLDVTAKETSVTLTPTSKQHTEIVGQSKDGIEYQTFTKPEALRSGDGMMDYRNTEAPMFGFPAPAFFVPFSGIMGFVPYFPYMKPIVNPQSHTDMLNQTEHSIPKPEENKNSTVATVSGGLEEMDVAQILVNDMPVPVLSTENHSNKCGTCFDAKSHDPDTSSDSRKDSQQVCNICVPDKFESRDESVSEKQLEFVNMESSSSSNDNSASLPDLSNQIFDESKTQESISKCPDLLSKCENSYQEKLPMYSFKEERVHTEEQIVLEKLECDEELCKEDTLPWCESVIENTEKTCSVLSEQTKQELTSTLLATPQKSVPQETSCQSMDVEEERLKMLHELTPVAQSSLEGTFIVPASDQKSKMLPTSAEQKSSTVIVHASTEKSGKLDNNLLHGQARKERRNLPQKSLGTSTLVTIAPRGSTSSKTERNLSVDIQHPSKESALNVVNTYQMDQLNNKERLSVTSTLQPDNNVKRSNKERQVVIISVSQQNQSSQQQNFPALVDSLEQVNVREKSVIQQVLPRNDVTLTCSPSSSDDGKQSLEEGNEENGGECISNGNEPMGKTVQEDESNTEGTDSKMSYKCEVCSQLFRSLLGLQKHLEFHTNDGHRYTCTVCFLRFGDETALEEHLGSSHTKKRPHKCSVCPKAFRDPGSLQKHVRVHTGEKPYKCNSCPRSFAEYSSLRKHQRIHTGEQPYRCPHCSKAFSISGNLQRHILIHTGQRPYTCNFCTKAFNNPSHLRRHVNNLHFKAGDAGVDDAMMSHFGNPKGSSPKPSGGGVGEGSDTEMTSSEQLEMENEETKIEVSDINLGVAREELVGAT